jgi:hypothetical protein
MHEYVIEETQEHVGYAWAQGNCKLVRMGHKHTPHIDGTRACPGYLPVALMAFDRSSPPVEPMYNMWKERIDVPSTPDECSAETLQILRRNLGVHLDPDDHIRSFFK